MLIKHVAKLSPIDRWLYWIKERDLIRCRRLDGVWPPWTDDEILQSYRFCNVRRMDDKVSDWLLRNWYVPFYSHTRMPQACALARFINRPSSLDLITPIVFNKDWGTTWRPKRIISTLRKHRDKGNTVFNGAYMVRGNDGTDKIDCVVNYYVQPLAKVEIVTESMEQTWINLLPKFGMGSFMAGQIVADLRWATPGFWSDKHSWAPMGPGSRRGLNRLLGLSIKTPMSQATFIMELQKLINIGTKSLPKELTERLEAQDWQSSLCEFDKYERILQGEGRPKQRYPGV